ncbi:hypothetical protein ACFOGJ_28930 [Marinibaculum pumilum]|uniref:Uncharacterized protein n=1 Tax=Marinibaculum pumilum TaxID=1766165 RepID=A0ABV7L9Q7_9PROT
MEWPIALAVLLTETVPLSYLRCALSSREAFALLTERETPHIL